MNAEHLLLVSLGRSPGAVLALLDHLRGQTRPVTDLWVVTTNHTQIVGNLDSGLIRELKHPDFIGLRQRILIAREVTDIRTPGDHEKMEEILYRVVLQGHAWRRALHGRRFTIGIVGGRKTMSAVLQQAATFFEVDALYHLAYDGEDIDSLQRLVQVRSAAKQLHPVCMRGEPSPWHELLRGPWQRRYPDIELSPASFPLDDNWSLEGVPAPRTNVAPVIDPRCPSLPGALNAIANLAAIFASPESLAAGLGGDFLRHDLRELLAGLGHHPEIEALNAYLRGLRELTHRYHNPGGQRLAWSDIEALCRRALTLALGRAVTGLVVPECFRLELRVDPATRSLVTNGFSPEMLLVVLRNLLANVRCHGSSPEEWDEPTARLILRPEASGSILLEVRNRLPAGHRAILFPNGATGSELPHLLEPGVSCSREEDRDGREGLGLFVVTEAARQSKDVLRVDPPRLEADPGQPADFVIRLHFRCQPEVA